MLNESVLLSREGFQAPARAFADINAANSHYYGEVLRGISSGSIISERRILYRVDSVMLPTKVRTVADEQTPSSFGALAGISIGSAVVAALALSVSFIAPLTTTAETVACLALTIGLFAAAKASEVARGILDKKG